MAMKIGYIMVYDLKEALVTLTEVDKKIMTALGRRC